MIEHTQVRLCDENSKSIGTGFMNKHSNGINFSFSFTPLTTIPPPRLSLSLLFFSSSPFFLLHLYSFTPVASISPLPLFPLPTTPHVFLGFVKEWFQATVAVQDWQKHHTEEEIKTPRTNGHSMPAKGGYCQLLYFTTTLMHRQQEREAKVSATQCRPIMAT